MSVNQAERSIGVKELKEQTDDVLRRVRDDREVIDIAEGEVVIARIVPMPRPIDAALRQAIWERRRILIEDIGKAWPEGVSAADAVAEQRRAL